MMIETIEESWGLNETIFKTDEYCVRRITLKSGMELPYRYNTTMDICWTIAHGDGIIIQDSSELNLSYGTWWIIPHGSSYMCKSGPNGLVILQTETGNFSDNQVIGTSLFI